MNHPAFPPPVSRIWLITAITVWVLASWLAPQPAPLQVAGGRFEGPVTLRGDVVEGKYGSWALGEIEAGPVLVELDHVAGAGRGDTITLRGNLVLQAGRASGRPYGAVLETQEVEDVRTSSFLPHRAGEVIRETVISRLEPFDDGRALLAGFLIGDTSRISEADVEDMRRSGLAHFVAVSGSNVALFLALLAVVAGPLALGPRRRAAIGLLGLPIYAAATQFEPSVMRASMMAGIALGGRLLGVVLEAWQLLSVAIIVLVVADPILTGNAGFQLSVAATAGVLVGARWPARGRIARSLAVTLGAQIAVAPLLVIHFGAVPLLAPVTNLVTAPLVAASTVTGALGVAGVGFLVGPAAWIANLVLVVARGAAGWPQVPAWGLAAIAVVVVAIRFSRHVRPVVATLTATALVVVLINPVGALPTAGAVVLDVGQGDAILLYGGDGSFGLVDGGPDGPVLIRKLRDYGVKTLELVVLTHVHADHATGLTAAVDHIAVGEVWADTEPHSIPASQAFFAAVSAHQIPVRAPPPGTMKRLGALELVVEGPVRRYASTNDQSIVITVRGAARTMLLTGDIELHAQDDLRGLEADVLKVPHHGGGTSDPGWLVGVGSDLAIISVGVNDFGHPVDWVVDALSATNRVLRTDQEGDVIVDLTE